MNIHRNFMLFFYLVRGLIFFDVAFFFIFIYLFFFVIIDVLVGCATLCLYSVCRKDSFSFRRYHLLATRSWCLPAGCHSISFPLSHLGIMGISSAIIMIPEKKTKKKMMRKNCTEWMYQHGRDREKTSIDALSLLFGTTLFLFFLSLAIRETIVLLFNSQIKTLKLRGALHFLD